MRELTHAKRLEIISRAWGKKQEDEFYCFFPWIDREEQARAGTRRAGFHEGRAYLWPSEREAIIAHFGEHENHDLYWCPSLFDGNQRLTNLAVEERSLWADLDAVDPRTIEDYPPSIAWETSPGRYQALWVLNQGDMLGSSMAGKENQRMTYHVGADQSGWDTTQLLRIPGWVNHKLDYRVKGKSPIGKLLWDRGRTYLADDFSELPEMATREATEIATDAILGEIQAASTRTEAIRARVWKKLTRRVRDLINAKEPLGDRSSALWEIERSLADAGCTIAEIVAIVQPLVWNKHDGRGDEYQQLIKEAIKARAQIPEEKDKTAAEAEDDERIPNTVLTTLDSQVAHARQPKWLVKGILTEGGLGFISGEPKSFKSWFGLDLAMSISSGTRFLNEFDIVNPGPVLYIQEEDSPIILKGRVRRIRQGKKSDRVTIDAEGSVEWSPPSLLADDLPINALLQGDVIISDERWQLWLADQLRAGYPSPHGSAGSYRVVIIDTLMMVSGIINNNDAQEMTTKIFKPIKQIARDAGVALIFIHHSRKSGSEERRGGQRMLGSVANHAWSEDSLYLTLGKTGTVEMEAESKSYKTTSYRITGIANSNHWEPQVTLASAATTLDRPPAKTNSLVLTVLQSSTGPLTATDIKQQTQISATQNVYKYARELVQAGSVREISGRPVRWEAIG